ncbi:conjugal transfer protein TraO [Alistipes sp. AF48-12]|jgi:putative conjugative transposon protein traO|uniref:conjugal transfer protein TraO n=1 Tax=Alistipes sp. AF48-12 TaxID=2291998 RepID=UPI000E4CAEFF|nr:conjugal transfer protein TraO [Alistipes sp. AF48-12]RHO71630.1 conjugal transfer protein TraO [Alistipes sp. AF48-12]
MIRKMLFILLAAAGLQGPATELSAQRCLPGQTGVQLGGGACGGFLLRDGYGAWSFHAELSVVRYVRKTRYWEFGVGYLRKDYPYREAMLPKEQFTAGAGYFVPIVHDRRDNFMAMTGVSGLLGYETVNRGEKRLYDGAALKNRNNFIYGGEITLSGEAYLCDRAVLLLMLRERIMGGSSVSCFHTLLGVGLRIMIY